MDADPDRIKVTRSFYFLVNSPGGLDVDPEFVFAQPGGYIRMRLGEDVRVDAQGDPGVDAPPAGPLGEQSHFGFTLRIEDQNPGCQGQIDLLGCLAHTRKDDSAGRLLIHLEEAYKLSTRDDIEPRTLTGKQLKNGQIGVCLHRIANEVISMAKRIGE